ncbi:MAG: bL17 family ribosomal protein, partial [Chloroflexota bacterium]
MRHRVKGKRLGRDTGHRKALRMNLATALLTNGRIKTTRAKAEFVRGHVEKLITVAKRGLAKAEETGNPAV